MRKMFSAKQIKEMSQKPSIYVKNITKLTDDEINGLDVGDVVAKKTGSQFHCYIVTYKQDKHGICLSYFDGSGYLETISYDYTAGHWVYNSKDVTQVPTNSQIDTRIENLVEGGTLDNAKPIYCHPIRLSYNNVNYDSGRRITGSFSFLILNNDENPFTWETFRQYLYDLLMNINSSVTIVVTGAVISTALTGFNDGKLSIIYGMTLNKTVNQLQLEGISNDVDLSSNKINYCFLAKAENFSDFVEPSSFIDGVNKIN